MLVFGIEDVGHSPNDIWECYNLTVEQLRDNNDAIGDALLAHLTPSSYRAIVIG